MSSDHCDISKYNWTAPYPHNRWIMKYPLILPYPESPTHFLDFHYCVYGVTLILMLILGYILALLGYGCLGALLRYSPSFASHSLRKLLFFLLGSIGLSRGVFAHVAVLKFAHADRYVETLPFMEWFLYWTIPANCVGDMLTVFVDILLTSFWLRFVSPQWTHTRIGKWWPMALCLVITVVAFALFGADYQLLVQGEFDVGKRPHGYWGHAYARLLMFMSFFLLLATFLHSITVGQLLWNLHVTRRKVELACQPLISSSPRDMDMRTPLRGALNTNSAVLITSPTTPQYGSNAASFPSKPFSAPLAGGVGSKTGSGGGGEVSPRLRRHLFSVGVIGLVSVLVGCIRGVVLIGYVLDTDFFVIGPISFADPLFATIYLAGFMYVPCLVIGIAFFLLSLELLHDRSATAEAARDDEVAAAASSTRSPPLVVAEGSPSSSETRGRRYHGNSHRAVVTDPPNQSGEPSSQHRPEEGDDETKRNGDRAGHNVEDAEEEEGDNRRYRYLRDGIAACNKSFCAGGS